MAGLAAFVAMFVQIYSLIILVRVLMSWVNVDPYNSPLARTIIDITEPVLQPIRNMLPPTGGIDFSPVIAIILLQVLGQFLISLFS